MPKLDEQLYAELQIILLQRSWRKERQVMIIRLTFGQLELLCMSSRAYTPYHVLISYSFAMLVGVPPFQSTTQNEIYRRARNVEYDWPKPGKHQNDIPEEAKDLVYQLLKVDAEERPDPDQVVGHPFFAMHGGNAIPMVMEESFRRETPNYLDLTRLPRGDVMLRGTERLSLRILASQCGVGHLAGDVLPQPAVGGDIEISLFGQCQAEEDAGDAPIVPMPKDMVYVSKFASAGTVQIPAQSQSKPDPLDLDTIMEDAASSQSAPEHVGHSKAQRSLGIPSVPSHAATLRASHVPLSSTRSQQESVQLSSSQGRSRSRGVPAAGVRARRGLLSELPVRPTVKGPDAAGIEAKTLARKPRATRTKKVHVIEDAPIPDFKDIASSSEPSIRSILKGSDAAGIEAKTLVRNPRAARGKKIPASDNNIVPDSKAAASVFEPLIKLKCEDQINSDSDVKRRDVSARTRARIAVNVHNEMVDAPNNRKSSVEITDVRKASELGQLEKRNLLIGPGEVPECLPNTKPDEVLQQLQELHKQLEASLNGLGKAKGRSNKQDLLLDDSHDVKHRPVISKWVDYTNRYGIGYTLANGTVGCIFKADDLSCSTCVVVANAESHLLKRRNTTYPDKHQMVPAKGAPVEFVENCDDEGLKRVFVQPSQYQRNVSAAGVPDPLGPGFDMHDFQKRTRLAKWDKLGVYMTQSQFVSGEMDVSPSSSRRSHTAGPFAKFYQRLGNVGVWGFGDGSFQFNFPDHTKIFVSHGGTFLDFYHLTLEAAQTVKGGDKVTAAELSDRGVLSCPTTALLNGCYRGEDFKDLITANDLRSKVSFITDVVGIWVEEGGLGCMGTKNRMMWEGIGGKVEKGSKLVWVTAGAKGGDERYECRA